MLFMTIFTWEPDKTDEVIKARAEIDEEVLNPKGMKTIGEWTVPGGHRSFRLVEVDDSGVMLAAVMPWVNLGKIESVPVIGVEEGLKQITAG